MGKPIQQISRQVGVKMDAFLFQYMLFALYYMLQVAQSLGGVFKPEHLQVVLKSVVAEVLQNGVTGVFGCVNHNRRSRPTRQRFFS